MESLLLQIWRKNGNGIEEFAIEFDTDKPTPLEKARVLHIAVTERFNELINSDPVRPTILRNIHYPIRHTKVQISFKDRKGATMKMARWPMSIKKMIQFTIPPSLQRSERIFLCTLHYFMKSDMKMPKKIIQKASSKG